MRMDPPHVEEEVYDCVIIGAGIAGLTAARECQKLGLGCVVLEASARIGGRIKTLEIKHPKGSVVVEAGAEFIHGERENVMVALVAEAGIGLKEMPWPNYFYAGKEGTFSKDGPLDELEKIFESVTSLARADETLLQYFVRQNLSSRNLDFADAMYANDYGNEASAIGALEVAHEQRRWRHGEAYLLLQDGKRLENVLEFLAKGLDIRLNERVTDLSKKGLVKCGERRSFRCKSVIVTIAPAARLQMAFPSCAAADAPPLAVANGLKAFVVVDEQFWPSDFWNALCADSFFPEIWLSSSSNQGVFVLVGFAMGHRADRIARLDTADVLRRFLNQLDAIFGTVKQPHPATTACVAFKINDWSQDLFARGAYTYPSPGCLPERTRLAEPLYDHRIFFAGEATNSDLNPCLQGAMDTGIDAARDVASCLLHGIRRRKKTKPQQNHSSSSDHDNLLLPSSSPAATKKKKKKNKRRHMTTTSSSSSSWLLAASSTGALVLLLLALMRPSYR